MAASRVGALAGLFVLGCAGQAPAPPALRITVTLVQVDAVVTDSQGRHVADLRPEDFEILQDGEIQKITYFSFVPEDKRQETRSPLAGPPAPVTPGQVKRTVALVVDDLALSFGNLVRVRDALRKYVEQQMQPGDLVAVVRTGGGVAILEQFTTDRRLLLEAIDLLKWRFYGRTGLVAIDPIQSGSGPGGAQAEPQILDYGYTLQALGALGTIEQVIEGMRRLPGRKSVVFLSDGLRMDSNITAAMDRLTDLSNRSDVSLYTVDPGGLRAATRGAQEEGLATPDRAARTGSRARGARTQNPGGQDSGGANSEEPDAPADFPFPPGATEYELQDGLSYLASRTGGLFFSNRNDIGNCIRQATDDQAGYYLLGYSPKEGTFEAGSGKPKFHRLTVRLRRRGLQVRWKSGFNGVPDAAPPPETGVAQSRERQLLEALASPFTATGLKVRLTSMFYKTQKTGPIVHSMLHFGAKDLAFTQDPDGTWHAAVDIVSSAYRGVKQPVQQRQRRQEIRLPDDQYQKSLKEGFLFLLNDRMKEPGMFLMRAVVRDAATARIGSASQYIQVPDTRKGKLAMSGIVIRLATPEVLEAVGITDPKVVAKEGTVEAWSEGGPAVRRFRPGQSVLYGYLVINPKTTGAGKETRVVAQLRLFRNGELVYTGPSHQLTLKSEEDPSSLVGGGLLRMGTKMTPGEYLIQVAVKDESAGRKNALAAQWIDFEVTAQ